ncbi:kinase-like domain-containing protein [Aspergillus avenaceus]|uniref:Kinase-like domain-containing protein n=1 Tax=Aspergillus avenaceus TaxID=36643 RepID=A0A5N6U684_ASPAV|nr:kinase-like domain-containing protein [Aspergillus avenaceus]
MSNPCNEDTIDDDRPNHIEETTDAQRNRSPSPDGSIALTFERRYYHCDSLFIKRNLRPSEYRMTQRGTLHVPRLGKERLQNEAECLRFIRRTTDIPVPTVYGAFEINDSFYLITEYIQGISMASLSEEQKRTVGLEIRQHLDTMHAIKSNTIGGPSGIVIPPYRAMRASANDDWPARSSNTTEYVFCHNDLSQQNIIVDPDTLRIRAIIDWEYSGFFPEYFDSPFYERLGPSVALEGENDDVKSLLKFLCISTSE